MLRRWFDRRQYAERNPMIRSRAFVYVRLHVELSREESKRKPSREMVLGPQPVCPMSMEVKL